MKSMSLPQARITDLIAVLDNLPKDAIADNKTYRLRNNALTDIEEQNKEYIDAVAAVNKKVQEWLKDERKDLDDLDVTIGEEKDEERLKVLQAQKTALVNALNKRLEKKFKKEQDELVELGKSEKTLKLGNEKFDTIKKMFDEHGFKIFNDRKAWGVIDTAFEGAKNMEE